MEIYFDNSATTKPYDEVIEETCQAMKEYYGNPSSLHNIGLKCEKRLNEAREYFATTIKADKDDIYFTSGGSEGNNLVLRGLLKPGHHLITTSYEHQSVLDTCKVLENNGVKVTYLPVDKTGRISLEDLDEAITKDTVLVSIMHVNNEVGTIQDLEAIGKIIKARSSRAKFHVDGVQSYGKIPVDVKKMNIDYFTAASHKIHGPKGIGVLYIDEHVKIKPIVFGGEQQKNVRSGTENVPGIAGLAKAAEMLYSRFDEDHARLCACKRRFIEGVRELDQVTVNGLLPDAPYGEGTAAHIVSVSFAGVRSEVLLHALEDKGIYVSAGSACSAHKPQPSAALKAIGVDKSLLDSTIRFSFSVFTTEEEIDVCLRALYNIVPMLRRYSRR